MREESIYASLPDLFPISKQPFRVAGEGLALALAAVMIVGALTSSRGADGLDPKLLAVPAPVPKQFPPSPAVAATVFIQEYRVVGTHLLPPEEVEEAVYPFLGPQRTAEDVEKARAALEKLYQDKGFQTVSVEIPPQTPQKVKRGIVVLQVVEAPVGRLRVEGSRYFDLNNIKKAVPSLAEGTVPNFNDVAKQIVALNQLADRRVTPTLRPGMVPGTEDVVLQVKDTLPLHGSVELNNRYSANTTPLRLDGSISYDNLWQLGHSLGFSFQIAPQNLSDAEVFSAYYIARIPEIPWLSLQVNGTRQNSNVSTLGGAASAGNGEIIGGSVMIDLPPGKNFFQSVSFGLDYKRFTQDLTIGDEVVSSPITYYPLNVTYNGAWVEKSYSTELTVGVTYSFRDIGTSSVDFDNRRFDADSGFIYLRGSLSHTHDLPLGFQVYGQLQGQVANEPLVDSEEFSAGGLDTVRGYLESTALGDNGIATSFELRSPTPHDLLRIDELRVYGFFDAAVLTINDPLPEQTAQFDLASVGVGARIQFLKVFHGSLDAGVPLITQAPTNAGSLLLTFRLWGDF